jgi:hypothetical protein
LQVKASQRHKWLKFQPFVRSCEEIERALSPIAGNSTKSLKIPGKTGPKERSRKCLQCIAMYGVYNYNAHAIRRLAWNHFDHTRHPPPVIPMEVAFLVPEA